MVFPAFSSGLAIAAVCALLGWIALLITCVVIVKTTQGTQGLRDFAAVIKAYRCGHRHRHRHRDRDRKDHDQLDDHQPEAVLPLRSVVPCVPAMNRTSAAPAPSDLR